jgi:NAD(P)-dependent dehydrogenase (short-subunit alcohol dehydrogenase family)
MGASLLRDKVVLVTGGASGIGRDCALAYRREGALVAIADLDSAKALQALQGPGGETMALECDVSNGRAVEETVAAVLQRFGRLDAIHNNAGIALPAQPLHRTTEEEWNRLFDVNVKALYWLTRFGIEALTKTRGTILSTASIVGLIGQTSHAAYVATKGALISLTKAMALDYAGLGIRVNAICPAGVWTPMLEDWCASQPDPAQVRSQMDHIHALGYCPQGDVVADAAVFLLSDRARFITGCILPVSGGAELGYRR